EIAFPRHGLDNLRGLTDCVSAGVARQGEKKNPAELPASRPNSGAGTEKRPNDEGMLTGNRARRKHKLEKILRRANGGPGTIALPRSRALGYTEGAPAPRPAITQPAQGGSLPGSYGRTRAPTRL